MRTLCDSLGMAATADPFDILTAEQVGEILQKPPNTLRNWRVAGVGPRFFYAGRNARYRRSAVQEWITEQERAADERVAR